MSYDVYWVKNRAEKIADFEHPRIKGECKRLYLSFASVEFKEVRECIVLYISKVYETPIHEFRTPYHI